MIKNATKKEAGVEVGDIFERTSHWNSSRTTFVKVIGFNKSGKKALVRELGVDQVDGDWMNGNVTANEDRMGEDVNELAIRLDVDAGVTKVFDRYAVTLRGRLNHTIKDKETGEIKWVNTGHIDSYYKWNGQPIWNNCD